MNLPTVTKQSSSPRTWLQEGDAAATATCTRQLAVESVGCCDLAELVQGGVAHSEGIQVVLVHVHQLLEKVPSVPA